MRRRATASSRGTSISLPRIGTWSSNRTAACRSPQRPACGATRPAADVLFASVAPVCTTHVIAVILTGDDSDGTNGLQVVKQWGGTVLAQDEASSQVFQMPRSAIATGDVDEVLTLQEIAPALLARVTTLLHATLPTQREACQ